MQNQQFQCDQCDFKSVSEKGLKNHTSKKHKILQTDGADSTGSNSSNKEEEGALLVMRTGMGTGYARWKKR